jgi:hypothetical protein
MTSHKIIYYNKNIEIKLKNLETIIEKTKELQKNQIETYETLIFELNRQKITTQLPPIENIKLQLKNIQIEQEKIKENFIQTRLLLQKYGVNINLDTTQDINYIERL